MSNIWIYWLFSNQHFLFCCAFETGRPGYDKTGSGHKQSGERYVSVLPLHCDILRYTKASRVKCSTGSTQQRKSGKSYKALERWRKDEINQHALLPLTLREDVEASAPNIHIKIKMKKSRFKKKTIEGTPNHLVILWDTRRSSEETYSASFISEYSTERHAANSICVNYWCWRCDSLLLRVQLKHKAEGRLQVVVSPRLDKLILLK